RRPVVHLERGRIAHRHLHAFLLSEFFRRVYREGARVGAMQAFGRMGAFCGVAVPPRWDRNQSSRPHLPQPVSYPAESSIIEGLWGPVPRGSGLEGYFISFLLWARD